MKLLFDHTYGFGKMSKQSFIYAPYGALLEPAEHKQYLLEGWFPVKKDIWFQTRSTRINLSLYKPKKDIFKKSKKIKYFVDVKLTENKKKLLINIYNKYIKYKNFRYDLSIDDIVSNSHGYIYYVYQNNLIAFSFYKIVDDSYLCIEFAWDYENPSLSLGHVNVYYNSILAKIKRCKYMYLSSGYESCSIYKSEYSGFEWWKGYEWSNDTELYKQLCLRDDKIVINGEGII
jgi:hypothetical protein